MENIFDKWKSGLDKTRKVTFGRIVSLFGASDINDSTWDELEALLLQSDLGLDTTTSIIKSLQKVINENGFTKSAELQKCLYDELLSRLEVPPVISFDSNKPFVILLVGVNGSGKTTTAAKLGKQFVDHHQKVVLAAADTFRAAAVDQLQVWGDRLKIPVISGQPNADPGSVAYDSIQTSLSKGIDVTIIDTAGRLHTRSNLMEELKKVYRVINKALPGAPHAVWLVLDATTGQNALQQAKIFKEAVNVSGVIITKLDSSARGGMLLAIQKELNLPILYAGLGEKPEDFQPFDRHAFIDSLLSINS